MLPCNDGRLSQVASVVIALLCLLLRVSSIGAVSSCVGDYMDGEGTETNVEGVYIGWWVSGKKEGLGTHTYSGGGTYVGQWKGNKIHGQGVMSWPNGNRYDGEWAEETRHGQGQYTTTLMNKTEVYKGKFANNQPHGLGILTATFTRNGRNYYIRYIGEFRQGKKHGEGNETTIQYIEEFRQGKKHGEGNETTNGTRRTYNGTWENNLKHGFGTENNGTWESNLKHGFGTEIAETGDSSRNTT